ncbi:hypothetical protein OS190_10985 [Sulfitobacter sp. F26204]|uniref:hypothetical protein n=1 Tax=Sulfitobacter sp. F26204 TaxID=2996014 RepID=UPI00225DDEB8|nr:hypothetical protein [Sulfitobacter sp. F26204]MCX7560093.1 hypothetical protein [Sulfitobacter sp. F26204]
MTATAEFMNPTPPAAEPVRMVDGGRMIVRGAQRLVGVSLTIAALALWMVPGSSWENDVMLFKLILSLTAVIAGLGLVSSSAKPRTPEVEIDTIRREVRLVRRQRGVVPEVLQSCGFAQLARAEHEGSVVRLWDHAGKFLAEVSLTDRSALSSLVAGLRDAGKLA